jgi:hypothetical protein
MCIREKGKGVRNLFCYSLTTKNNVTLYAEKVPDTYFSWMQKNGRRSAR